MFDGASAGDEMGASTWTPSEAGAGWKEVDRKLRGIARRRAALDAEEARWLREAERVEVWKPLGMVNMTDYMERAMGYAPRTAQKRLQVARALATLPALTDALSAGELPFSAVRELVRVATPTTENEWLAHVDGMNLRQIEDAVAGRRPGDRPSDVPDDDAREHVISLRVNATAYALWRQGRLQIDEEHDHRLDDSELIEALFSRPRGCSGGVPEGNATAGNFAASGATASDSEISGRAKFQIALAVCPRCERGWQEGGGVRVPVDAATVARARCDAQHLGSLDGDVAERAHQDIPPSVVRFVWRRDQGRCQTPGCRSSRALELHHIEHREHGGSHEPKNLTLRCSACHAAHHRGLLAISGEAPDRIITTRVPAGAALVRGACVHVDADRAAPSVHVDGGRRSSIRMTPEGATSDVRRSGGSPTARVPDTSMCRPTLPQRPLDVTSTEAGRGHAPSARARSSVHVDAERADLRGYDGAPTAKRYDRAVVHAQARDALVRVGWKSGIARAAVEDAHAHLGVDATLVALIREALRRCPVGRE